MSEHQCLVVTYLPDTGLWQCGCGQMFRIVTGYGHVPLENDGTPDE